MKSKYIFPILLIVFIFSSCQKMEYDKQFNWSYPVSGDWTITVEYEGGAGPVYDGPYPMKTYNTSFGQDSIWIDDYCSSTGTYFWPLKAKAAVNMDSLTFRATNSISYAGSASYEDYVTITNAKIIQKDSIYFEVEFASDAGNIYKFYGHRRVSYEEYNNEDLH